MWRNLSNSYVLQQCRQNRFTFVTVVSLAVILGAFFISYGTFASDTTPALPSLKLLHVVFRHGGRTPTYTYTNDPYKDYAWPDGRGALTSVGKEQLFTVGETFRRRYDKFLGDLYDADEVYMKSSYAPRCQMSAMTFLASLFPPHGHQIWNEQLLWQPIPVNPIPREVDNLIAAKVKCPAYDSEKRKSDEDLHQKLEPHELKILEFVSDKTGEPIKNISLAESLYGTLKIQKKINVADDLVLRQRENGLKLPNWTEKVFPAQLAELAGANLASFTRTPLLKRLQAGPMLKEWVTNMNNAAKSKRKANFYSGHDLTLVSLLRTLGFEDMESVEYGASLIIEYHEAGGEAFVQVYYLKDSGEKTPNQMKLPYCEVDCPLTNFIDGIRKFIPDNWELECKNST